MRTLILTVVLLSLIPFSLYASGQSNSGGLAERVAELEAQVEVLAAALQEAQETLQFVRVETEEINGVTGPHWIIEGANVHVRSGSGRTSGGCEPRDTDYPNCESLTGLGNLMVGYNEPKRPRDPPGQFNIRTGSHNLVVGDFHSYSSFAGFVAGIGNDITAAHASVSGGTANRASGYASSISGGNINRASDFASSVSGGSRNEASGAVASVSGGEDREAPDDFSWAAGNLFEPN
jgi:hypothetical protein